jgi:2-oxoglutarate ferredoxin oxidoreductase subunit delta
MKVVPQRKQLRVAIDYKWCKGCAICVALCPKEALRLDQMGKAVWEAPDKCVRCGLCELRCPDLAIELVDEPQESSRAGAC